MPGKNGKKGFLKLSNDEVAFMGRQGEDSGSEIELLDVTEIDHYSKDIERKSRGRGCCCDCCIAFYLFLITIAIVFIILFVLGTAYNVQVLKKQVSDMDSTVQRLKTDLNSLKHKHEEQANKHKSHLHALNTSLTTLKSTVTGLASSVTSLTSNVQHIELKMSELATQLNVTQVNTFNKSMATVLSFSKDVNDIHISMAHLNSIVDSLNDQVTETKKYCSDFGTKIETISSETTETNDAINVIKNDQKARNKYVDLKLLKLNYFKGNTTQKLHQMEWVLKTSPEELINTFMNRTSPSEDHLNEIIDLKQKLTELRETMDFVLGKLTNLTEATPTVPVTPPPTNTTVKITPITDQTTPSSSKTPDTSPKHSSTSATEDHPKTNVGTSATPTRSPNTTTSANKPHPTDAINKTINIQPNNTDNDNNETTLPTGNKTTPTENTTTPTGNSTDFTALPDNTTETPTSSSQRAEQALKHILDSFDKNDVDQDGRLSLKEFTQIYDNTKIFKILDRNHDHFITKTELKQLLKHVKDEETAPPPAPQDYIDYDNSDNDALTPDDNKP